MTRSHSIAVLPGDGIGPEVIACALEVLDAAESRYDFTTERTEYAAGANHYLETGELFAEVEDELRGA
ncbi:isocitrate/isopropylmalate family dehydrogenase, partial [Leucobacter sp. G161]|uniref:isocitrate/isopropylmalate family dehydrogenase n=1 Tax=Leucobacter sp. G161 TaxID=663704 RepID=UPI001F3592DD